MTKPLLTGVLKTWKEDRGFGFISPDNGSRDVFIHISALGETIRRPIPGDIVHYQLVRDRNGKFRAINASIEDVSALNKVTNAKLKSKPIFTWVMVASIFLLVIIIVLVFKK
jgi:cold shock CspA family protein